MGPTRSRRSRLLVGGAILLALAACGSPTEGVYKVGKPYQVAGRWYHPTYDPDYDETGTASWYGSQFHGRPTANGEVFDRDELSAAHPTLPLPSIVKVTNLANGRSMVLRVNDRGPFVDDRIIDLSQAAARELGYERKGTTPVRVQFIRLASDARGPRPVPVARREVAPASISRPTAAAPPERRTVAPPQPAAVAIVAPSARCEGRFIQVGAYREPERAHQAAFRLLGLSWPVTLEQDQTDRLTRIRVGPIDDRDDVLAALRWLKREGHARAYLVGPGGPPVRC
jgi:rare lipoprotein A